jgi:hypothetical protein
LQAFAQAACEGDVPLLEVTALRGGQASAAIPLLNVPDWSKQRVRLAEACPGVVFHEDKGLVSLVGDSLASSGGALPKVLGVLASRGLSVHAWSAGPLRISAVVDGNVLAEAQRALHQAFVLGR